MTKKQELSRIKSMGFRDSYENLLEPSTLKALIDSFRDDDEWEGGYEWQRSSKHTTFCPYPYTKTARKAA